MPEEKNRDTPSRLAQALKALIPQRGQDESQLGPMMRAIRAVHSVASAGGSTSPEDLERQRAGQELFAKLVTPAIGVTTQGSPGAPHPRRVGAPGLRPRPPAHRAVLPRRRLHLRPAGLCPVSWPASWRWPPAADVFSFEYRLAPEHPYPAAVQDAQAVWDHLMYQGFGARDVILAGDSAGGNLALELCLNLKEQGRRQPRMLALFSPWTDMTCSGLSHTDCADIDPMLTARVYRRGAAGLHPAPTPTGPTPATRRCSATCGACPPPLIQVGTNEILALRLGAFAPQAAGGRRLLDAGSLRGTAGMCSSRCPIRRAAQAMGERGAGLCSGICNAAGDAPPSPKNREVELYEVICHAPIAAHKYWRPGGCCCGRCPSTTPR